jgi:hypothetical protein
VARGLATIATEVVIAEIGPDMNPFPTAGHLLSWAGLVPGLRRERPQDKRRSTRIKKGAPWLKPVLAQAAWAAAVREMTMVAVFGASKPVAARAKGGPTLRHAFGARRPLAVTRLGNFP